MNKNLAAVVWAVSVIVLSVGALRADDGDYEREQARLRLEFARRARTEIVAGLEDAILQSPVSECLRQNIHPGYHVEGDRLAFDCDIADRHVHWDYVLAEKEGGIAVVPFPDLGWATMHSALVLVDWGIYQANLQHLAESDAIGFAGIDLRETLAKAASAVRGPSPQH